MLRERETLLVDLAKAPFRPEAWREIAAKLPKEDVAVVMQYLACTDWFGHKHELQSLAEEVCPGMDLLVLIRLTGFQPGRFRDRLTWPPA